MPTPRRAPVVDGPTSAASYVLECKLRRAYDALLTQAVAHLHRPADRLAVYVQALGGKLANTQVRGAEKRLREGLVDVILKLDASQQLVIKTLLLDPPVPDLAEVVAALVKLERNINYRDDDPRLSINDDARLKAAGMGHLSRSVYGNLKLGPPLVLEPLRVARKVVLRTKKKSARKPRPVLRGQLVIEWPWVSFAGGGLGYGSL